MNWLQARLRKSQRLTRSGWAFTFAMMLVAAAAFISANNLLFLILAAMLSTFLISGFVGGLGLAGLELDLFLPPHASARRTVRARVQIKNLKRWLPSFSIHLSNILTDTEDGRATPIHYFPVIAGNGSVEEVFDLRFDQRGSYKQRTFQVSTGFPFGFTERRERVTVTHDVLVYPCLDPQPGFDALLVAVSGEVGALTTGAPRSGQGTELYRIRPYEVSESARRLDWKATAHTGQLQVREFSEEHEPPVVIYLDLDLSGDIAATVANEWFESAVDCAAYLLYELAHRGLRVRLRTQDYDRTAPDSSEVYEILKYLALVSSQPTRVLQSPDDPTSVHIGLTANPARLSAAGWNTGPYAHSKLLGPHNWPQNGGWA